MKDMSAIGILESAAEKLEKYSKGYKEEAEELQERLNELFEMELVSRDKIKELKVTIGKLKTLKHIV